MRISQKNVHSRGTQSNQSTTSQGTKSLERLVFPKCARILKRKHFKAIAKQRKRYIGQVLSIDFREGNSSKLGITVTRQFGNAVKRNLFKRRVREAFRFLRPKTPPLEIVVHPKKGETSMTFETIFCDLLKVYTQHAQHRTTKSR